MSSTASSHIFSNSPSGYGSLLDSSAREEVGEPVKAAAENGLERSMTFHDVGYEVSVHCGRRTKVILNSCR